MQKEPSLAVQTTLLRFDFDGRSVTALPSDTLAAALTRAGILTLRSPGADDPGRGIFCGMGVCQDCLVTVDGVPERRACMTDVAEGMQVESGQPLLRPDSNAKPASPNIDLQEPLTPQLLVIGGGAAGLSAALTAARLGVQVTLLDERKALGGQYFKQARTAAHIPPSMRGDKQAAAGRALIEAVYSAGVTVYCDALVWGCEDGSTLFARVAGRLMSFRPGALIVAGGAYERVVPRPGWTLPGVMTTGAAQTLLRTSGTLPGKRVLIAGNGPLNLQVAVELARAGSKIVAIVEAAAPTLITKAGAFLRMLGLAPDLALQGLRLAAGSLTHNIAVLSGMRVIGISTTDSGLSVHMQDIRNGTMRTSDCDVLCLSDGFLPNNELLRLLGCRHEFDALRGHLVTVRDANCMTSIEGIFAIGDCCGLNGARAAMHEGEIAALAALAHLDQKHPTERASALDLARRNLEKVQRFQRALWRFYAPVAGAYATLQSDKQHDDETLLCRCERITLGKVRVACVGDNRDLGAIKRATRIGMGACQGRYCLPAAIALLQANDTLQPDEFTMPAPRMPLRPLSCNDLLLEPTE